MAQVGHECSRRFMGFLEGPAGLTSAIAAIGARENVALAEDAAGKIVRQQIASDLAERTAGAQYPMFYVYCEKVSNQLREKFRTFSGKVRLSAEVRVSHERLEELGKLTELYAEALTGVLDAHRGDWGGGLFYGGGYEVTFQPIRHGGRNFVQSAKVTFEVEASLG